jgi:hypothetical protein
VQRGGGGGDGGEGAGHGRLDEEGMAGLGLDCIANKYFLRF